MRCTHRLPRALGARAPHPARTVKVKRRGELKLIKVFQTQVLLLQVAEQFCVFCVNFCLAQVFEDGAFLEVRFNERVGQLNANSVIF